jgi:hypothetical protein
MKAPHLLRLPVELHLSIIDKLELQDNVSLAFTNRYFRSIIKPPTHPEYVIAEADGWAKNRGLFACSGCTRFRRFEDFADDMKKGKHVRGGQEASVRLCLRCGVFGGLYAPGMHVYIYGKPHVLCRNCKTFTDHVTRQAICTKCSPRSQWLPASSTYTPDGRYVREYLSTRSSKVYQDRMHMDELYGDWPDD